MKTAVQGFVHISQGIEVPGQIQIGKATIKLKNLDDQLIIEDQNGNTRVLWQRNITKLKGLCHQGDFILAGKLTNKKWEILRKQKIDKPVCKWALRVDTTDPLELGFLDPQQIINTFKRGRQELSSEETCSMCLETLDCDAKERVLTQCGHEFHRKCLAVWVFQNSCPNCRRLLYRKKQKLA